MRAITMFVGVAGLAATCFAGEIRKGATLQVKADSIWFQDAGKLARWQALKRDGDARALAVYQQEALHQRNAWRFTKPLAVKIIEITPKTNRLDVEMMTEGRLQGSRWLINIGAIDAK